ncbi:MAG: 50S ribosomal protein L25/general stress protein Ctc [Rhodospirillaceae bacterium]|jgi:large subunit ribosomal protein L25|nr:50S ribosomal protein L25/general stress protein Ctc [Rhodospirillaceae bacterium]
MNEVATINVEIRNRVGSGGAREIRCRGLIPGIIYGNNQISIPISINPRVLWIEMNKPGFFTRLFNLSIDDKIENVLCRGVQYHPVSNKSLHVDFMRVSSESKVHVHVPIHFNNHSKSVGLKKGGVLNVIAHELELIAPVNSIPNELIIDLTGLDIGASIHLSAINLPIGVSIVAHEKFQTIATIVVPTVASSVETEIVSTTETSNEK